MGRWRLRGTDGDGADIVSLLGEGATFAGDLNLDGGARIDGKVVGRVSTKSLLVVGPNGDIDAQELHAVSLTVCGTVRGKLTVAEKLEVRPGGRVQGHIVMHKEGLVVAPGGLFEGVIEYTLGGEQPDAPPQDLEEVPA